MIFFRIRLIERIRYVFTIAFLLAAGELLGQNVGINETGALPNDAAILDIAATDKGVLIPRMTSTQRGNISSPVQGLLVFDSTTGSFWFYTGSAWQELGKEGDWVISGSNQYSGVAGNVGVGIDPTAAKFQVSSTGTLDGLRTDHNGSAYSAAVLHSGTGSGFGVFHSGTGSGQYLYLQNAANAANALDLRHDGLGRGLNMNLTSTSNGNIGLFLEHEGTGRAIQWQQDHATSTAEGLLGFNAGLGIGGYISQTNAANTAIGFGVAHAGAGTGLYSDVTGNGTATYSYMRGSGNAMYSRHDGTAGYGHHIQLTNTMATRGSSGLLVQYAGADQTGAGGGNVAEFSHTGNNGTGVEIFMGNPDAAAGPTNTTSEFPALRIDHMATGISATAGISKNALMARSNGGDATVSIQNLGTEAGLGIYTTTLPQVAGGGSTVQSTAIYGQAFSTGIAGGIGMFGYGGDYGVIGYAPSGTGFGIYSFSNSGTAGTKSFHIDHPLDPENKTLTHFSIESNEVLNVYRGTVALDANGEAVVQLPDYFEAGNTNPSYQLTPVGSPTQPWVKEEVQNNAFVVAGAPNGKVSWAVYAERNDPTLRYFMEPYKDAPNERMKTAEQRGHYITPGAYGGDQNSILPKQLQTTAAGDRTPVAMSSAVVPAPQQPKQ